MVDTTEALNNKYKQKDRSRFKDGFSAEFLINKWHLETIIEIRRHILGKKGRRKWTTNQHRQTDLLRMFNTLRLRAEGVGLTPTKVASILTGTKKGQDWWTNRAIITHEDCDVEIKALKQLTHGRQRQDNRLRWKKRTAWLERMASLGKCGKIIKAVLKGQAGRKHQNGLNLDTVRDGSGKIYVTPKSIHQAATRSFQDWYGMPEH